MISAPSANEKKMTRTFDIPVDVARERVYRFRVSYEPEEGGYKVAITLHPEDNADLVASAGRVRTVEVATQAALDCVARDVGCDVCLEGVVSATEQPWKVTLWVEKSNK